MSKRVAVIVGPPFGLCASRAGGKLADARASVAQSVVSEAKSGPKSVDITVKTGPFIERAVSYLRSACGTYFEMKGGQMVLSIEDGTPQLAFTAFAEADCGRDPNRRVRVNPQAAKQGETIQLFTPDSNSEAWKAADIFPIIPESALRATLGILDRTVRRGWD